MVMMVMMVMSVMSLPLAGQDRSFINWTNKEFVCAMFRVMVKRILRKSRYLRTNRENPPKPSFSKPSSYVTSGKDEIRSRLGAAVMIF